MKSLPLGFVCALLAGVAAAQETPATAAAPQPRTRLDPATRAAVTSSVSETKSDPAAAPVVMMDRFVVKGIAALPFVHRKEPVLRGKFTPWRGGDFATGKMGKVGWEFGLKPWFDLFEYDASFKHSAAARINLTVLQLSW